MDDISKLGFLAAEVLLKDIPEQKDSNTGLVFSNSQSTLVTDSLFQDSIKSDDDFYPSPSVFVYTLPNIMLGEISIRNKFRGENAFFIFDRFNEVFLTDYINLLFSEDKVNKCIGGWVDQSKDTYEAFMYFVHPMKTSEDCISHNPKEVRKLYEFI